MISLKKVRESVQDLGWDCRRASVLGSLPAVTQGFIPEGIMGSLSSVVFLFWQVCSPRHGMETLPCLCVSYGFYCSNSIYLNVLWGEGGRR